VIVTFQGLWVMELIDWFAIQSSSKTLVQHALFSHRKRLYQINFEWTSYNKQTSLDSCSAGDEKLSYGIFICSSKWGGYQGVSCLHRKSLKILPYQIRPSPCLYHIILPCTLPLTHFTDQYPFAKRRAAQLVEKFPEGSLARHWTLFWDKRIHRMPSYTIP
jgi:hypothetical protein